MASARRLSTEPPRAGGAALIVNARARSARPVFERAGDTLAALGIPLERRHLIEAPERLEETARVAVDDGCRLIILGGGDGTLSSLCGTLARSEATVGVIPLGTANDFARTLGIPPDVDKACEVIAGGNVVDLDLGLAAGHPYLNVASVGFGAAVAEAMSSRAKKLFGPLAYPVATVKVAASIKPFAAQLSFPDGESGVQVFDHVLQIAVGNGRFYGGGRAVSAAAGIDDGALDVYVLTAARRVELIKIPSRLRSGEFEGLRSVASYRTGHMRIETDPPLKVNADGELRGQTPAEFSVARNALEVIVPAGSLAARLDRDRQ